MILVIGGHSRNIGKTSVVANLIRALPQYSWTAIKITQFGHGVCSKSGADCECATDPDHPFALTHESNPLSDTDTARFLRAGAHQSLWLRTRAGELGFALPALQKILETRENVIIESNSVMQFVRPDAYLVVLDPSNPDFKTSSRLYLDRADAFLFSRPGSFIWDHVSPPLLTARPSFLLADQYEPQSDVLGFLESRRKVLSPSRR